MEDDIKDYISYISLERKLSKNTIYNYTCDLENYLLYLKEKQKQSFNNVTLQDINDYFQDLKKEGLNAKSIARHITTIRELHRYLLKMKRIDKDVTLNMESIKQERHLPTVLKENEMNEILNINLDNAFKYRDKAMLELMYGAGLRVSELVNLTLYSIDFQNDIIIIEGKGSEERLVPLNPYAKDALKAYLEIRPSLIKKQNGVPEKLFLNNHGKGITRQGFNLILKNILEEKNIKTHATPHTLRHTFATDLLNNGADLKSIQTLLGHSDIATTSIYTHIVNNKLKDDYMKYNIRKEE